MESEVVENDDCVLKVQRIWRIPKGHKSNSSLGRRDEALSYHWTSHVDPRRFLCAFGVLWSLFFLTIQPFRAASQWQDHKNSRVQPLGWLSGFSVFALLIWTLKKIRMSDSAQNPNWRKPISPKNRQKCLDGVFKLIFRFYRFWSIFLW